MLDETGVQTFQGCDSAQEAKLIPAQHAKLLIFGYWVRDRPLIGGIKIIACSSYARQLQIFIYNKMAFHIIQAFSGLLCLEVGLSLTHPNIGVCSRIMTQFSSQDKRQGKWGGILTFSIFTSSEFDPEGVLVLDLEKQMRRDIRAHDSFTSNNKSSIYHWCVSAPCIRADIEMWLSFARDPMPFSDMVSGWSQGVVTYSIFYKLFPRISNSILNICTWFTYIYYA